MKPFLDTNVLIYAVVAEDSHKQLVAQGLLAQTGMARPTLSTQILGEAYNVLRRKKRWAPAEALAAVRLFASLRLVVPSAETVLLGLELAAQHGLSGWDAMVVQAALQGDCDTLFSENLQAGRRFGNLEVVNPFELRAHEPAPPHVNPSPTPTPSLSLSGRRTPRR